MKPIAFLSMDTDTAEAFFVYDDLLIPHFNKHGYEVKTISWRKEGVNWNDFSHVIVRSTWDYQQSPEAFKQCLHNIDKSSAQLHNPLTLMLWNIEKTYLNTLQEKGVPVVPTQWEQDFDEAWFAQQFDFFDTEELVIKPALSANSDDTFRLTRTQAAEMAGNLKAIFTNRLFMVQPFLRAVVEEGEYSLFFFAGIFSHGLLKQPKSGDFRVQEEHGGRLSGFTPDSTILSVAEQALAAMPAPALYARVDLIKVAGTWAIMELELIEPSLYFNIDPASPARFVDAFISSFG